MISDLSAYLFDEQMKLELLVHPPTGYRNDPSLLCHGDFAPGCRTRLAKLLHQVLAYQRLHEGLVASGSFQAVLQLQAATQHVKADRNTFQVDGKEPALSCNKENNEGVHHSSDNKTIKLSTKA